MRITHEADYALRICYVLGSAGKQMTAKALAEKSGVTVRFTLKILRRLAEKGIVSSSKGVYGGYCLKSDPAVQSIGEIVECIDGPLNINHCISDDFECSRVRDKDCCRFHRFFVEVSADLRKKLYGAKLIDFIKNIYSE